MYTTFQMLKTNSACVGGFGRLAAFFGIGPAVRDQKIPLHVVALIGGATDAEWALTNALTIDRMQFDDLFQRTLPAIWHIKIQDLVSSIHRTSPFERYDRRKDDLMALVQEAFSLSTSAGIVEYRRRNMLRVFSVSGLQDLLGAPWWDNPRAYLKMLYQCYKTKTPELRDPKTGKRMLIAMLNQKKWKEHAAAVTQPLATKSKHHSAGQHLAHILQPIDTYAFLATMESKAAKMVKRDGKKVTITVSDEQSAFLLMRGLHTTSVVDPDCEEEELDDEDVDEDEDAAPASNRHRADRDAGVSARDNPAWGFAEQPPLAPAPTRRRPAARQQAAANALAAAATSSLDAAPDAEEEILPTRTVMPDEEDEPDAADDSDEDDNESTDEDDL